MSIPPTTPNKSGAGATKSIESISDFAIDTLGFKQNSLPEPSPASTYGETAAGDSLPVTPQDRGNNDQVMALVNSLGANRIDDSTEYGLGSPFPAHSLKQFTAAPRFPSSLGGDKTQSMASSITKLSDIDAQASSPVSQRLLHINESPTWRRGEANFVREIRSQGEDPFVSSSGGSQSCSPNVESSFQPRQDRAGLPLSADTAQAILPPTACVFVANLTQAKTDDQLEFSVSSVFQAFGNVYVKIRRDGKGMPFAFCQYENASDAQRAITMGRGMLIDGRPCRTEVAKVNRSLYLSKITGGQISESEARQVLSRFGAIEKMWYCSQTDKEMFRLPEGIWVMFAFFQDCRDAQADLREDPTYRLEQPPKLPEDARARLGPSRAHASPVSNFQRLSPARSLVSPQAAMKRAADLCSVFVGNLPSDATDDKLRELFGMYGRILHIEVVRKPSVNASGVNTFAFIEYCSPEEAEFATHLLYELNGNRLRVERKDSPDTLAQRDSPSFPGGSPAQRSLGGSTDAMTVLFQRGVSLGIASAAVSQPQNPASSVFGPYQLYPPYNMSQYNPFTVQSGLVENDTSHGLHIQANSFGHQTVPSTLPQTLGQFHVPTISQSQTAQYMHYPSWTQRTNNYQWPPVAPPSDGTSAIPTITKEDIR